MKVTWQQPPARGLGPTVLVETEGTVSRFVLKPHKDNIYLLEDVRLDKDLASAAREAVWEGFCDWMKKEQLLLLLGCRAAQSWFGAHPGTRGANRPKGQDQTRILIRERPDR